MLMNFLIAGRDTTATTLTWLFYELGLQPHRIFFFFWIEKFKQLFFYWEIKLIHFFFFFFWKNNNLVQEKIYEEIVEHFGTSDAVPSNLEELKRMKYLKDIVNETLRLHPPVPRVLRCSRGDDILPSGFKVLFLF